MLVVSPTVRMQTLIEGFRRYLREERHLAPATVARYVDVLEKLIVFLANGTDPAEVPLDAVTRSSLMEFLCREAAAEGPSRPMWNIQLSGVRAFYQFLAGDTSFRESPAHSIERVRIHSKRRLPLSLDEYLDFIEAIERGSAFYRARNVAIAQVFFHTALRVASVASLNVDHLDFENYLLHNVKTKGGKWHSPPMNDLLRVTLERWLAERELFRPASDEKALFLSDRGTRLSVRAIQEMVRSYGREAGISHPVSPHPLRHSSATELAELTTIQTVQLHCDHESIVTTQRYVHAREAAWRSAVQALGEVVRSRAQQRSGAPALGA